MKHLLFVIFLFILIISCNQNLNTYPITINESLSIPKIDTTEFRYPWGIIKHTDGHFENITSGTITKKDTTKINLNAKCYTTINNHKYRLPFANGKIKKDTLILSIFEENGSHYETLSFRIYNNKIKTTYQMSYVFPYKNIEIDFHNVQLTINQKPPYYKGQHIKGKTLVSLKETIIYDTIKTTSKHKTIQGSFEVILK